jgi:hypothetical protein
MLIVVLWLIHIMLTVALKRKVRIQVPSFFETDFLSALATSLRPVHYPAATPCARYQQRVRLQRKLFVGLIIAVLEKEGSFEKWAWLWADPVEHFVSTLGLRLRKIIKHFDRFLETFDSVLETLSGKIGEHRNLRSGLYRSEDSKCCALVKRRKRRNTRWIYLFVP